MKKLMLFALILIGSALNLNFIKADTQCVGKVDGMTCTLPGTTRARCQGQTCKPTTGSQITYASMR